MTLDAPETHRRAGAAHGMSQATLAPDHLDGSGGRPNARSAKRS